MDLISIFRAVWRHKLATIPVILFTCLGAFYVVAVKAPVYQASDKLRARLPASSADGCADRRGSQAGQDKLLQSPAGV